jgi:hypothetical protein
MPRTLLALALIALPEIARAVCGDGIFDAGEKCDPGLAATSAYHHCCNATCDGWLDADGDHLCDDEDVCTRSDSAHLTEASLRVDRIAPPAGDERLRFTGRLRFPASAFADPAVAGFRFGLHGETFYFFDLLTSLTPMMAARIPGGAGWSARNGTWRFRDSRGRYAGVTSVTLKLITPAPVLPDDPTMTLAYSIKARRGGYVVTPDIIEPFDRHNLMNWGHLETQMALGSTDGEASCAQRAFPSFIDGSFDYLGPILPCAQNRRGSTITCSTAPPIGPCRVGEPRDVLKCEVLTVAAAEEAYKATHGTYLAANCASLPGYTPTPESGVSCSVFPASSTGFTIAAINNYAPNFTCMYYSTATPALDCF